MVSRDCFVPCPLFVSQSLKGAPVPGRALLTAHPWGFVAVDTVSWPWLSLSRSSCAPVGELDSSPLPEEQLVPQAGIPRHSQAFPGTANVPFRTHLPAAAPGIFSWMTFQGMGGRSPALIRCLPVQGDAQRAFSGS